MDERLMKAMLEMDEHHWWYRGRRQVVDAELSKLPLSGTGRILDAGCGSGRMLQELVRFGEVFGLELDPLAAQVATDRRIGEVRQGRLEELPWPDDTFELITCLDVIEHTPDDSRTLGELRRVAQPGGWLLVTVPAYQALWSLHDVANHHYRRYGRRALRRAAVEAGWTVERVTSFNTLLLPPAAVVRLIQRSRRPDNGYTPELNLGPQWLNSLLELPLRAEAGWLGSGRRLPAGLSLLAIFRNPSAGR